MLANCIKLAQKDYRKYGIEVKEKWYKHKTEVVMENDKCKILWDFTVQTDMKHMGEDKMSLRYRKIKICLQDNRFCLPL